MASAASSSTSTFSTTCCAISTSDGGKQAVGLYPRTVADFYASLMRSLAELGIDVRINELPNEIPDAIRFSEDQVHASYDRDFAPALLAHSASVGAGARAVPHIVHRQMQSGAFLLGEFRSRGDALLGAPRAEILRRRRRAEYARSRGARRLFARGQQRRLLAGRAGDRIPRFLFLRLARAGRLRLGNGASGASCLELGSQPIHPALRRGAHRRAIRSRP